MSTTKHDSGRRDLTAGGAAVGRSLSASGGRMPAALTVALRLSVGWIFLWAFLDKLFGLGHETPQAKSWLNGGRPTEGFLKSATGPFKGTYQDLAGHAWVDWLFMIGLAGIGLALLAGVAMRIAAGSGAVLLVMMWSAVLPPDNNPFMDSHLVDAMVLIMLAATGAGQRLGLGRWWERLPVVRKYGWLR
jgi:thiosulfate dehydrogenase (quinone) large subunit